MASVTTTMSFITTSTGIQSGKRSMGVVDQAAMKRLVNTPCV